MSTKIATHVPAAESAISTFLQSVLNSEVPISISLGEPGEEAALPAGARSVVCGQAPHHWIAHLMPAWIPVISKAILGEPMESTQPESDDLLVEMVGQVVSNVARAMGPDGRQLPHESLKAVPAGTAPPTISRPCLTAVIVATMDDGQLAAWVSFADPDAVVEKKAQAAPDAEAAAPVAEPVVQSSEVKVSPVVYQELGPEVIHRGDGGPAGFDLLGDVELDISVEIGRRNLSLSDVLKLTTGSVIELEKLVGEPLEVYANGRLIAEGEAVVIDEQFGIRITRLASPTQRAKSVS